MRTEQEREVVKDEKLTNLRSVGVDIRQLHNVEVKEPSATFNSGVELSLTQKDQDTKHYWRSFHWQRSYRDFQALSVVRSNIVCDLLAFPGDVAGDGGYFCVEFSSLLFLVNHDRDFRYPDRADSV
jgi:hypothetical protein